MKINGSLLKVAKTRNYYFRENISYLLLEKKLEVSDILKLYPTCKHKRIKRFLDIKEKRKRKVKKKRKEKPDSLEDKVLNWNLESLTIPQLKSILAHSRITLKIYLAWQVMAKKMEERYAKKCKRDYQGDSL